MMADNLAYVVARERGRGKVLAFAHNSHLQRRKAEWQLGTDLLTWWPAGAHLDEIFGPSYAVIGTAVGVSDANGIGQPEAGTLEARLTGRPRAGAVHSHSQRPGASSLGNRSSSDSLGQYDEPDLLRTDSSKLHRFRLAGGPG